MGFKSIQTRITYERDGTVDKLILRLLGRNTDVGKASEIARRCLCRYDQLVQQTSDPAADLVTIVGDAIANYDMNLLYGSTYPDRRQIILAIGERPIPKDHRDELVARIEKLTFAEYAKLIEAIEQFYLA
jgi:hypothetical protein